MKTKLELAVLTSVKVVAVPESKDLFKINVSFITLNDCKKVSDGKAEVTGSLRLCTLMKEAMYSTRPGVLPPPRVRLEVSVRGFPQRKLVSFSNEVTNEKWP